MRREANEACLRAHISYEMQHDIAGTLATLHEECLFVDEPLGLRLEGRDGARRHYELWWSAFGATLDAGQRHWVSDDLLIGEAAFVGRHVGEFAGVPATGREIRVPFVVFVDFRDGLLGGERFVYDLNGLLTQLGRGHSPEA